MAKLFGTDGVRGLANYDLTPELAFKLGLAAGSVLKAPGTRPSIVVGRDSRLSGPMLENALTSGICAAGVDVLTAGIIPTPTIAYLARTLDACAGVVISASHNPAPDNGIKFFNNQGYKLDDVLEDHIDELVQAEAFIAGITRPTGKDLGRIIPLKEGLNRYLEYLKTTINVDLQGLRIVVDCANGAAYEAAPRLLMELGAQVITIFDQPDGLNINCGCGSTHPEALQEAVVRYKAHLGIAHDGDADRVIAVDETGQIVNGDQIMVICGLDLQQKKELDDKIVVTVMSNLGLKKAFSDKGVKVYETKVGDRYVLEKMLETNSILGGEQSGHIIYRKHSTTGDGILTALQLLQVMQESGSPLSELAAQMVNYPQVLLNAHVKDKTGWEQNDKIIDAILMGEKALQGQGRLFVRPSGTEALIRVMAEGPDKKELEKIAAAIAEVIQNELS